MRQKDRVSLITGSRDAISGVVQQLVKKMKERHRELNDADTERERTVKMVVACSTIGMIIGKRGETVEQMKQRSGANILISKKDEVKIPERVITLVGEVRSNQVALDMILEKVSCQPFDVIYSSISPLDCGGSKLVMLPKHQL